ncbi:MAG: trypsin-like peptidase domain-containing protein [Acidobacteriota bacterium]
MRIAAVSVLVLIGVAWCALAQDEHSVPASVHERTSAKGRTAAADRSTPGRMFALAAPRTVSLEGLPEGAGLSLLNGAVAVHREVPADLMAQGEWTTLPDGRRAWRLAIHSPEARSIRVHFDAFDVAGGQVWLGSENGADEPLVSKPFAGQGPFGDGEFWSNSVYADTVWVEYVPAADQTTDAVPFAIDQISHYFDVLRAPSGQAAQIAKASSNKAAPNSVAPCQLEAKCYTEYADVASGIAQLQYERNGFGYVCSGALVNSTSQRAIPYLLTANHCISNDAEARTLQSNFFYEANICGGANTESPVLATQVLGAKYLSSGGLSLGDYSLLLLSDAPDKAMFLGWTTADIAVDSKVIGIHHPQGSYKRISFGKRTLDQELVIGKGEDAEYGPANRYWTIEFTEGLVQGGSSGSPLLNTANQVVGTLTAGPGFSDADAEDLLICKLDPFEAFYGRFANGFPSFRTYLEDAVPASMTSPANGAVLPGPTVDFTWSKGTSSDDFKLYIGTTAGGSQLAVENAGNNAFHRVNYLPTDGSRIFVRFWYRMLGTWRFTDYTYTAARDNGKKITIHITNRLLYPVQVKANGSNLMVVNGGAVATRDIATPAELVVSYDMIRPVVDGAPAGEPVSGTFPGTGAAMGTIPFTVTNTSGNDVFFAPFLYNGTGQPVSLVMNSGLAEEKSCGCTAVAGANGYSAGYYLLRPGSNIHAVNGATSALYQNFTTYVERNTGIVRATFTTLK